MSLSLLQGSFFSTKGSRQVIAKAIAKAIAKFEHFDDQERKRKEERRTKRTLKKQKETGRKDQEKETKEEERTNQTSKKWNSEFDSESYFSIQNSIALKGKEGKKRKGNKGKFLHQLCPSR